MSPCITCIVDYNTSICQCYVTCFTLGSLLSYVRPREYNNRMNKQEYCDSEEQKYSNTVTQQDYPQDK